MPAVSLADELDRIIREALAGPAQDNTRLRPVDQRLGDLLGLDPDKVRAKYVSDSGVVENRLGEGGIVNRRPDLVAVLLGNSGHLERVTEKAARLTGPGRNIGATAIFVNGDGRWKLASLVEPEGGAIETKVRALYPDFSVERPAAGPEAERPADPLRALIDRCKREIGYPREHDREQKQAREDVAHVLLQEHLDAAIDDPAAFDLAAFRRIASNAYGGVGNQGQINAYLAGGPETIPPLARTIKHVLYGAGDELDLLDDVLDNPEWKVRGFGEGLATKCLAIVYPDRWLPLFVYRGENGKRAVMRLPELPVEPVDERGKTRAQLTKESNDVLRDLLRPYYGDDSWGAMVFLWWLFKEKGADEELIPPGTDLEQLADELLLPADWLRRVLDLLEDKKQVIFYGPPGTGKTYVARRLARFIAPDDRHRKTVQFHPSYSYEDFVEGYRPREGDNGSVRYDLTPGPLRQLAKVAEESAEPCVLLIDEINRGNIAKVFGELYYLLEYRGDDDQIDLQYGSSRFELPENFLIIATMNTADRSIAILDAALRRRFHFVEFFPGRWPVDGLLRRWLVRHAPAMAYVADIVDATNRMLPDRHLQIGPSYFMRPGLDRQWLERIWAHSVLPYIEEQFFDEPDRVQEFELSRIEQRVEGGGAGRAESAIEEVDHLQPEVDQAPGVAVD